MTRRRKRLVLRRQGRPEEKPAQRAAFLAQVALASYPGRRIYTKAELAAVFVAGFDAAIDDMVEVDR